MAGKARPGNFFIPLRLTIYSPPLLLQRLTQLILRIIPIIRLTNERWSSRRLSQPCRLSLPLLQLSFPLRLHQAVPATPTVLPAPALPTLVFGRLPNPPVTTNTGSVTMQVTIRDCNVNTAPVNDNLTISLVSGDSNTQVNGNNLPYSITASNGTANFTVTSQITGTVTLSVHDDTNNFTVTNINNQNPSISFTASSGSSSCSTANGTPNSWYSDYYPSSGISANTGATVTITVHIRDCSQADVSSDNVTMTQTSSDSSLTINGSSSPVSVQAQNGIATFNLVSQNAGTDTFTVQDTTSNFAVTDINNQSLSITFSGSSTTPTPTPTPGLTNTPTPIATPS